MMGHRCCAAEKSKTFEQFLLRAPINIMKKWVCRRGGFAQRMWIGKHLTMEDLSAS